ncbi:MAG: competence protein CoiA [Lactovum sp.]
MLTAYDENGKFINLLCKKVKKQKFTCPACKSELILKSGSIKIPHFAHRSLKDCQSWSENESFQHLSLKKSIYQMLINTEKVELEKYLEKLEQTPDILINDCIAIEIQCSRLSIKRLFERTRNYQKHGYKVLWLLGKDLWIKNKLSPLQYHFLYFSKNRGFYCWELDLKRQKIRLKYLIHQNLRGEIAYLIEEFSFQSLDFLEIMRRPFQAQRSESLSLKKDKFLSHFIQQELYYCKPKWMEIQEIYYKKGKNLLDEDFPVHWFPLGLDLFSSETEQFCQISEELSQYYRKFLNYHEKNPYEKVFSPAFYDKIKE